MATQIANLKDWRRLRTKQIATRSGLVVTMRRDVTVLDLVQQGTIPLPLIQKLTTLGNVQARSEAELLSALGDDFGELLGAINAVCCATAQTPRILPGDEYQALLGEAAALLGVSPGQVLDWLMDDAAATHLAGLPAELRRRLDESIPVGELSFDDRSDLFNAALAEAAPLASFPG